RKRRTREHVIADLSVNHVERFALLCGFSVEQARRDYGIDLFISTYNRWGEIQNGQIRAQLKATDHLRLSAGGQFVTFRVELEDLHHWLEEPMPVILIVYDAKAEVAYWLYVQAYFERQPSFKLAKIPAQVTVRIPRTNIVDQAAMKRFAAFR